MNEQCRESAGIHSVTRKLRGLFPKLLEGQYQCASGRTKKYNCIAWAAGHNDAWWEAGPDGFWPVGILADGSVAAAIQLFEHLGYTRTHLEDVEWEPGVLEVAIYGDDEGYTHAARQIADGRWTSKIGKLQDIEHDSLEALTSMASWMGTEQDRAYGKVVQIMRRPEPPSV